MQLAGRLGSTTLGDVLGSLHRERASGVLELREDLGAVHRVRLLAGEVTEVTTEARAPRLGEILEELGGLDAQGRREVERSSLGAVNRPLGGVLLDKCLITRHELLAALRYQNKARLERLYALKDARISFRVARVDGLPRASLSPQEVIGGRPRARDTRRLAEGRPLYSRRRQALAILGLSGDATQSEIQRAFRRLASRAHPDRTSGANAAARARAILEFARLSAAYHRLVA